MFENIIFKRGAVWWWFAGEWLPFKVLFLSFVSCTWYLLNRCLINAGCYFKKKRFRRHFHLLSVADTHSLLYHFHRTSISNSLSVSNAPSSVKEVRRWMGVPQNTNEICSSQLIHWIMDVWMSLGGKGSAWTSLLMREFSSDWTIDIGGGWHAVWKCHDTQNCSRSSVTQSLGDVMLNLHR